MGPISLHLGILISVFICSACDRSPQTAPHGAVIAVIGASETDPQWPGIAGGARRYFADVPLIRGHCLAPAEATSEKLLAVTARALDQQPRAVCFQVADPRVAGPAIELVLARAVPVVTIGLPYDPSRVGAHVAVAWPDAAEQLGAQLDRIAAGRLSYVLLHAAGRDDVATTCYDRFKLGARSKSDLVLLREECVTTGTPAQPVESAASSRAAGWVAGTPAPLSAAPDAAHVIEALLDQFPSAGLLVTLDASVWLQPRAGWRTELRRLNADFRFATLSTAPVLWARLGTPEAPGDAAALAGPLDGEIGHLAVSMAMAIIMGDPPRPATRTVRCEVVTADALPDFARRYSAAANNLDVAPYLPVVGN